MATLNRPNFSIDRLMRLAFFALIFVCALGFASQAWAATYYIALNGNDSYNGLSPVYSSGSSGPFRTFQHAAYALRPGDTVQIRGGTYVEYGGSWGYSTSGTEASPITITAYPGETVIIDGANHTIPSGTYDPLMQVYGDWYRVSNIEFRYGSYAGLNIIGNHCTVDNIYAHHNSGSGIFTSGDYNTIVNCRVHYNSMDNEYGVMPIGWGFGISLCANAQYSTIRNCTSWNNWGEGLSIASGYYCTIEDNVSYDNFSTNIYLSQSVGGVVRRNLSYYTNGNPIQPYVSSQNCIFAGDEGKPPDSTGNMIVNNLTLGGDRGLLVTGHQAQNLLVAYNTFVNAFGRLGPYESGAVFFNAGSSTGGRFVNNIILQEDGVPISHMEATGVSFGTNNWSQLPLSGCRGTGDVIGNPQILKTGSTVAGELSPGWFKIQDGSPAHGKAVVLTQVTEDFVKTVRGNPPDIGAFNGSGETANLTASASGTPTSGQSPLTVNFSGSATGGAAPYTYQWTFGDGGSSSSQNPSHIYATSGRYTATLTAVDGNRTSATATVSVAADATIDSVLTAFIGSSSVTGQAPFAVTFTGSANGGSAPYTY
ncbi:MAG: PKD domain-containing protein, partial [Candidatus Aminicenantales bacterium]